MAERLLYQFTLSPFCIKIRKILEFKGLEYRTVEVNPFARGEVVRLSGQKRVPVMVEREGDGPPRVVSDSTAIALDLESRFPDPPILPAEPAARARIRLMEDWADERFARDLIAFKIHGPGNARRMVEMSKEFYEPVWYYDLLYPLGPSLLRQLTFFRRAGRSMARMRRDYEGDLDMLESLAAQGPFLGGDGPTLFDFAVWGLLRTMEGLSGEALLSDRRRLAAWYGVMARMPGRT